MSLRVDARDSVAGPVFLQRLGFGRLAITWTGFFVGFMTLIAALVRLPNLAAKGFWYDELISVNIAREPIGTILRARLSYGASSELVDRLYTNNPPFHLLLIHWTLGISSNEAVARFPFALAGIATVPVTFLVLTRLFSQTLAMFGTALLAVSPLHIAYSQEARPSVLLVLFSLLSLYVLLCALDGEGTSYWIAFVAFAALNCWSSYFAVTLVMPTLGVITIIKLMGSLRHPWPKGGIRAFLSPGLAFVAVGLCVLPLLPDILMTADRNQVTTIGSWQRLLQTVSTARVGIPMLLNPVPDTVFWILPILVLSMLGLVALILKHDRSSAILGVWIGLPFVILQIISSSHQLNLRYILWLLPLVLVLPFVGLTHLEQVFQPHLSARSLVAVRCALAGLVLATYLIGLHAYETRAFYTGPTKRDWREVVQEYRAEATADSCLILIDDVGMAIYNEVPYYLKQDKRDLCAIDVRDPRLGEVVATHGDLWWGVAALPDKQQRLVTSFSDSAHVFVSTLVVLIREDINAPAAATRESRAEATLRTMIATLPLASGDAVPSIGERGGLVNLLVLTGHPPAEAAELVRGVKTSWGDNDAQQWDRARRELERGNVDIARTLGVRIVALYPGNPDAYELLAEIDDRAGGTHGDEYRALADALRT